MKGVDVLFRPDMHVCVMRVYMLCTCTFQTPLGCWELDANHRETELQLNAYRILIIFWSSETILLAAEKAALCSCMQAFSKRIHELSRKRIAFLKVENVAGRGVNWRSQSPARTPSRFFFSSCVRKSSKWQGPGTVSLSKPSDITYQWYSGRESGLSLCTCRWWHGLDIHTRKARYTNLRLVDIFPGFRLQCVDLRYQEPAMY